MPRGSRIYLTLYFNVERTEDLDLLTLLYALPLTRRGPAIKQILRRTPHGLPGRASPGSLRRSIARPCAISSPREPGPDVGDAGAERADGGGADAPAHPPVVDPRGRCPEDNRPGSGGAHGRRGPGPVRQRRDPPRPPAPVVPAMRVSATECTRSSVRRDARTASRPGKGPRMRDVARMDQGKESRESTRSSTAGSERPRPAARLMRFLCWRGGTG